MHSDLVDIDIDQHPEDNFNNFDFDNIDQPPLPGDVRTPSPLGMDPSGMPLSTGPFNVQPPSYSDVLEGICVIYMSINKLFTFLFVIDMSCGTQCLCARVLYSM